MESPASMDLSPYFRIRINSIYPKSEVTFDIYIYLDSNLILFLKAGSSLTAERIQELHQLDSGSTFFIPTAMKQEYRTYIKNLMNAQSISKVDKSTILKESSSAILEELFQSPDVKVALDESKGVIKDLIQFLQEAPEAVSHLITLSGHDFYTYNHSFDVSIYSIGLGQVLGLNPKTLEELGQAAIFHDIGKRNVPLEVLCKTGPLTDEEWVEMKKHPAYGLQILQEIGGFSEAVRATCYQHHENWKGGGYPENISGDKIHYFARIVAITDTYDAITTQRSYNAPMKPTDALELINTKLSYRYDPEFLSPFYSVLFKMKKS